LPVPVGVIFAWRIPCFHCMDLFRNLGIPKIFGHQSVRLLQRYSALKLLGFIQPLILELKSMHCFYFFSHSDSNLEKEKETVGEDDKAVLLEGGLSKSPSTKLRNLSTKTNLIR
jgi:hypothetical protein